MTEKEFLQQVWRPYDTVVMENGIKGRVQNVCFSTRSVRIKMADGIPEWFRCELIKEHNSATGETEDLGIIADLHEKLMAAQKRIEDLQAIKDKLEERLRKGNLSDLMAAVNSIAGEIKLKKKRIEKLEENMEKVSNLVDQILHDQ